MRGRIRISPLITKRVKQLQMAWSKWMYKYFNRLSPPMMKAVLIISCMMTTAFCGYLVIQKKVAFAVTRIHLPVIQDDVKLNSGDIKDIKRRLDSCKCEDSLRPGLIDSIHQLEKMYNQ